MPKAQIKIAYRHIIDVSSKEAFERKVFNDSYSEFLVQSQTYNQENKLKAFRDIVNSNPKANSLHYKVGFAVGLYVKELNEKIPGLCDALGQQIAFKTHHFEIIDSHTTNKLLHRVAIIYETGRLTLLQVIGDNLILNHDERSAKDEVMETFTLKMQPHVSIVQWQDIKIREGQLPTEK